MESVKEKHESRENFCSPSQISFLSLSFSFQAQAASQFALPTFTLHIFSLGAYPTYIHLQTKTFTKTFRGDLVALSDEKKYLSHIYFINIH